MYGLNSLFYLRNIKKIFFNPRLSLVRLKYNVIRTYYDIYFYFFKKKKYQYNIIFLAGMPLSATTLVKNMFGRVPFFFTRFTPMPYEIAFNHNISESAFKYSPKNSYSLFKTHLNPLDENFKIIKKHNVKKVIVTYRDLRDVAVSRYHRLIKFPKNPTDEQYKNYKNNIYQYKNYKKISKTNIDQYKDYKKISKEEGINHSIKVVTDEYKEWILGWIKISKNNSGFVHFCKFEDLINNRKEEFIKMLDFYEIKLSNNKIEEILSETVGKNTVEKNMKQSSMLPWAFASNFRSGKTGIWKDEFTKKNIETFKKDAGNILVRLRYEKDDNW